MMAKRFIEEGRADIVLTGGVDEIYPGMLKGLHSMGQLRSFAAGFSEGAGILVLENAAHARSRNARILAGVGDIRTIGRLSPGNYEEGLDRLLPAPVHPDMIALSGTATCEKALLERLPAVPMLDTGKILGRSLAMGGLAMTALVLKLEAGQRGLHLAASPEGPYYAIDLIGGDPVSS